MIRQITIFSYFCICILGCQNTVNNIEDPKEPLHDIHIEGDVKFHGELTLSASNNNLNTKIWAENISTDTASIEAGPCAFNVIAYSEGNNPVWYNRPPDKYICTDQLFIYRIAPKEIKQLTGQLYISGQNWYWDIPEGDWNFVIEARTKKGESISFSANKTKMN
ncbi:hypothetical protein [Fodinibius sp.]|uniref:hypothetical protein n=1 Tax=Fodinibius sp. TaxID=1872440 RepID=UPI002ACD52F3|nr:hypothetical protein [Fodinibius sp.]MDZ7659261.1 hypothetical protein [Fodinibius sp.]